MRERGSTHSVGNLDHMPVTPTHIQISGPRDYVSSTSNHLDWLCTSSGFPYNQKDEIIRGEGEQRLVKQNIRPLYSPTGSQAALVEKNPSANSREKAMATHSSPLAWRIPGMAEPGGLPSMGLHRVRHDWSDLAAAAANARDIRDMGSIPGSGRSLGGGNGNPLQYSYLGNSMDRGAWRAIVHGVAKSQIQLKWLSMQPRAS